MLLARQDHRAGEADDGGADAGGIVTFASGGYPEADAAHPPGALLKRAGVDWLYQSYEGFCTLSIT